MKKVFLLIAIAFMITSCSPSNVTEVVSVADSTSTIVDSVVTPVTSESVITQ